MSARSSGSADTLAWKDRLAIAEHELTTVTIILAGVIDRHTATDAEWYRLTTALHRLRALRELK